MALRASARSSDSEPVSFSTRASGRGILALQAVEQIGGCPHAIVNSSDDRVHKQESYDRVHYFSDASATLKEGELRPATATSALCSWAAAVADIVPPVKDGFCHQHRIHASI